MSRNRTRAYSVTLTVHANPHANIEDVKDLLRDLSWVGGCRCPDDPAFDSLAVSRLSVKRDAARDKPTK